MSRFSSLQAGIGKNLPKPALCCPLWFLHQKIFHYRKRNAEGSSARCHRKLHATESPHLKFFVSSDQRIGSGQICFYLKEILGCSAPSTLITVFLNPSKPVNCYRMTCLMFSFPPFPFLAERWCPAQNKTSRTEQRLYGTALVLQLRSFWLFTCFANSP